MADFGTMPVVDNSQADAGVKIDTTQKSTPTVVESETPQDREISLDNVNEIFETPEKTTTIKEQDENLETDSDSSDEPTEDTSNKVQKKDDSTVEQKDKEFDLDLNLEEEKVGEEVSEEEPKKKQGRDYSGFKPEQVKILKHIPNYLLDETKAFIKQHESLMAERDSLKTELDKVKSGKLPDSYFEHEKAYLLHPKYEELSRHQEYVDYAESHWEEQMLAIEEGRNWVELQFDDKGKALFKEHKSVEGKIDARARLHVQKVLNTLREDRNQTQNQLGQLTQEFKTKNETTKQSYGMINDKFFSKLKDMSKLPKEAQAYYNAAKEYLNKQLPSYQDHPLIDFLAKSALGNVYKTQQIKKLEEKIAILNGKKKDESLAGPTSKVLSKGAGKLQNEKIYDLNSKDDVSF